MTWESVTTRQGKEHDIHSLSLTLVIVIKENLFVIRLLHNPDVTKPQKPLTKWKWFVYSPGRSSPLKTSCVSKVFQRFAWMLCDRRGR